jgi:hypothetical protein
VNDDRDLRDAFARLREADLRRTPRFRTPCTQPRLRRRMAPAAVAAAVLALAAAAYLLRPHPATVEAEHAVPGPMSSWRAPTDFLLQTPGAELTASVPRLRPDIPTVSQGGRS